MSASFPVPDAAFRFLMDIRTPITPAQITRTAAGILTGRIPLKAFSEKITRYRNRVNAQPHDSLQDQNTDTYADSREGVLYDRKISKI